MKMCCYVNKMKRIVSVNLFLLVLAGFLSGCYNSGESRERVLKIYNWADYIGEGVLEDFQAYYKEQTGEDIHIVYQTFDINEIMLTKIEKGHEDFDVVCPSEYIIERMLKKHLLLPIDTTFAHSPNYMNNVSPFIREQINKGEFYQFNLSSCIRQQNSLTAQFVSFSLSNLANIFYPPNFYNN